jgi:glutathione S-transferase
MATGAAAPSATRDQQGKSMTEPRIEIFGVPQSSFTRAVRIVLDEKGVDYDLHPVQPQSAEVLAIHPLGKIPALRHGEVALGESRAIVLYLDRLFPDTPMAPVEPPRLASEVEQWISIVSTAVDTVLVRRYVLSYLFPGGSGGGVDHDLIEAMTPELETVMAMLDAALEGRNHLAGGRFTFADALLLTILDATRLFSEGRRAIGGAANVGRYLNRHASRPSLVRTRPWP